MTVRVTWVCDGCSDELVVKEGKREPAHLNDWKSIKITIEGFTGYPVPQDVNGLREYELCPSCQHKISATFFPRLWPRAEKKAPDV